MGDLPYSNEIAFAFAGCEQNFTYSSDAALSKHKNQNSSWQSYLHQDKIFKQDF